MMTYERCCSSNQHVMKCTLQAISIACRLGFATRLAPVHSATPPITTLDACAADLLAVFGDPADCAGQPC